MPSIRLARIDYGRYTRTNTLSPHPTVAFEIERGEETFEVPITVGLRELEAPVTDEQIIAVARKKLAELLADLSEQSAKWRE